LKESNTRQQKEATYRLFAGYFGDRPLLEVRKADAVGFMDALRRLDPFWGKSARSKATGWPELIREFGDHPKGLSASSLNRHAQALSELWRWGEDRDRCNGKNPFANLRQRLKPGKNQQGYRPWSSEELQALFDPPPSRQDVTELMVVALHTGMRINEIASLTLGHIREEEGIAFIEVEDAKTEAGNRQVPIHPQIAWLSKLEGKPTDRVWPTFNPEGPGRKPGMDASTEFSRFKIAKGFRDRRKVFHSFRKNVTEIMERNRVPENEWAQVLGHERGFTYGRYSPDGITIQQKADLIALIEYPGMEFPQYRT
jgi:integrase